MKTVAVYFYFFVPCFSKNHVKALEKDVLYSKLHLHIPSVSLVLGIFYLITDKNFYAFENKTGYLITYVLFHTCFLSA